MKKILLLTTMALGLASASRLMAVDVYITGSTAFRANVFQACSNLFQGSPSIYYGDTAHGGATSGFSAKTASWVMSGTPLASMTAVSGTLIIHGLFTGSIQGIQTVEQGQRLTFPKAHGTLNQNADQYTTNSPTIGFSDADGASAGFGATGNYEQEDVCVQPFVMVKSTASTGAVTNITNVSWEQLEYGVPAGRIPLSGWTGKATDTNTFVYIYERTKDSGTRRCETAGEYYQFNDTVGVYIYDYTNNFWYTPSVTNATTTASSPNGVVGPLGLNNANLAWGYGYVGGGDIATSLNTNNVANQAIAYLSIGDSKSVGASNWAQVVTFDGLWPTAAGAGIHGNTGTNDFSPITLGYYPCWGKEVLVHPIDPSLSTQNGTSDQDITETQLGDNQTPGTFMGVFNAQTLINGGSPTTGSIERDIQIAEPVGATAIRLSEMVNSRTAVGGKISPQFP